MRLHSTDPILVQKKGLIAVLLLATAAMAFTSIGRSSRVGRMPMRLQHGENGTDDSQRPD